MVRFFSCLASLHAFSLNPVLTCPHCGCDDQLVSHGFVYRKQVCAEPAQVGKRLCCSNRFGRTGCGRTVQLYLTKVIPRLHYSASVMFVFVSALLVGSSVVSAFQLATGRVEPRHAWRWLRRLVQQLPLWRSRFQTPVFQLDSGLGSGSGMRSVLTSSLTVVFAVEGCTSCAAYQLYWQAAFC